MDNFILIQFKLLIVNLMVIFMHFNSSSFSNEGVLTRSCRKTITIALEAGIRIHSLFFDALLKICKDWVFPVIFHPKTELGCNSSFYLTIWLFPLYCSSGRPKKVDCRTNDSTQIITNNFSCILPIFKGNSVRSQSFT